MSRIAAVSGGNSSSAFPVSVSGNASQGYKATVGWGYLLKNIVLNNTQVITGLNSSFTLNYGNDLIWLEITFGSGVASGPTAATINSYGLGGTWAPGDLPGEYGTGHGPFEYQLSYDSASNKIFTQYIARIAIFASITSTHAPYPVSNLQLLNTNLMMEGDFYSGPLYTTADGPAVIGLSMPKPFAGPYISL